MTGTAGEDSTGTIEAAKPGLPQRDPLGGRPGPHRASSEGPTAARALGGMPPHELLAARKSASYLLTLTTYSVIDPELSGKLDKLLTAVNEEIADRARRQYPGPAAMPLAHRRTSYAGRAGHQPLIRRHHARVPRPPHVGTRAYIQPLYPAKQSEP